MDIFQALFKDSFIGYSFLIIFIALAFSAICEGIITFTQTLYFKIQEWLILKSSDSNKLIVSKAIIISCKLYRIINFFFHRIRPFDFQKHSSNDKFRPNLLENNSKKIF